MRTSKGISGLILAAFVAAAGMAVLVVLVVFNFQAEVQSVNAEIAIEDEAGVVKKSSTMSQVLRADMPGKYDGRNLFTVAGYVLSTENSRIFIKSDRIPLSTARQDVRAKASEIIEPALSAESREIDYRFEIRKASERPGTPSSGKTPISVGTYQPSGRGTSYRQVMPIGNGENAVVTLYTAGKKDGRGLYP